MIQFDLRIFFQMDWLKPPTRKGFSRFFPGEIRPSHHPIPSPQPAELAELQIDKDRWIGTEEAGPAFGDVDDVAATTSGMKGFVGWLYVDVVMFFFLVGND